MKTSPACQLAAKMGVVIDLLTRLPIEIWFQENPRASDTRFETNILELVQENNLLSNSSEFFFSPPMPLKSAL